MEGIFIRLFNVGAAAAWLVLAVLLARLVLRRAPKWTRLILWALVAVRLLVPFSIESPISLVPSADTIPPDVVTSEEPRIHTGIEAFNSIVNPILRGGAESGEVGVGDASGRESEGALPANDGAARSADGGDTAMPQSPAPAFEASVDTMQTAIRIASVVWLCGTAAMLIYALASYVRLRLRVREAVRDERRVWTCDRVASPFILGVIRARIYLPSSLGEGEREIVLAHERAHLRRGDHIWKPLGFALLAVNWYNPAIWVAYILLCRDVELACDERVIRTLGESAKAPYSRALIDASVRRRTISACPLAFGGNDVEERVKNVLNYKKPAFWIIIAALAVAAALAVFFLTSPKSADGGTGGETPAQSGEASSESQGADAANEEHWALGEDYSQKTLIGAVEYRLEKEKESGVDRHTYDGAVAAWIDVEGNWRYFYLTITESKRPLYSVTNPLYDENIVYADAFAVECAALKLAYPDGGDALSTAMRDSDDIVPGYAKVILDGRIYEIAIRDGHIVLSDGEA